MSASLASFPATAAAVAAYENSNVKFKYTQQSPRTSTRASTGLSTPLSSAGSPLSSVGEESIEQDDGCGNIVEMDLKRRLLLAELTVVEKDQRLLTAETANFRLEDGLVQATIARQDSKNVIAALEEAILERDRLIATLEQIAE